LLAEKNSTPIKSGARVNELIKRPEISYFDLLPLLDALDVEETTRPNIPDYIWNNVLEQVNIQIKYEGYINLQMEQAESFRKMENRPLPLDIDYNNIEGLRLEARQKLNAIKPVNFGQASRITGVSPADLSILMIYLKQFG